MLKEDDISSKHGREMYITTCEDFGEREENMESDCLLGFLRAL